MSHLCVEVLRRSKSDQAHAPTLLGKVLRRRKDDALTSHHRAIRTSPNLNPLASPAPPYASPCRCSRRFAHRTPQRPSQSQYLSYFAHRQSLHGHPPASSKSRRTPLATPYLVTPEHPHLSAMPPMDAFQLPDSGVPITDSRVPFRPSFAAKGINHPMCPYHRDCSRRFANTGVWKDRRLRTCLSLKGVEGRSVSSR